MKNVVLFAFYLYLWVQSIINKKSSSLYWYRGRPLYLGEPRLTSSMLLRKSRPKTIIMIMIITMIMIKMLITIIMIRMKRLTMVIKMTKIMTITMPMPTITITITITIKITKMIIIYNYTKWRRHYLCFEDQTAAAVKNLSRFKHRF